MRSQSFVAAAAVVSACLYSAAPSFAHHSFAAEWDCRNCRDFTGTLTESTGRTRIRTSSWT